MQSVCDLTRVRLCVQMSISKQMKTPLPAVCAVTVQCTLSGMEDECVNLSDVDFMCFVCTAAVISSGPKWQCQLPSAPSRPKLVLIAHRALSVDNSK